MRQGQRDSNVCAQCGGRLLRTSRLEQVNLWETTRETYWVCLGCKHVSRRFMVDDVDGDWTEVGEAVGEVDRSVEDCRESRRAALRIAVILLLANLVAIVFVVWLLLGG